MNWFKLVAALMQAIPIAVYGVEAIAKSAPGSTKKNMAMNALGLSSYIANLVDPQHAAIIDAATQLAGHAIDDVVKVANSTGDFGPDGIGSTPPTSSRVTAPVTVIPATVTPVQPPATSTAQTTPAMEAEGGKTPTIFPASTQADSSLSGSGSVSGVPDNPAPAQHTPRLFGGVKK